MQPFKQYYQLIKPGIVYANVLSATAGYLFASKWHIHVLVFLATLVGTSLIIAGACVYNNCLDRSIDKKMARTARRSLVTGTIKLNTALVYASVLSVLGFLILALWVNAVVFVIGLVAFIDYIAFYGYAKRHSSLSTLVGSISGSASILAGYVAFRGHIDLGGWLLFLAMTLWQMPHFYAIAMYRLKDYKAAGLPVMPTTQPTNTVKVRIIAYIVAFLAATLLLTVRHYAGYIFMVVMLLLSAAWLSVGIKNYDLPAARWGKKMFLFSLVVNLGFSLAVAFGSILA